MFTVLLRLKNIQKDSFDKYFEFLRTKEKEVKKNNLRYNVIDLVYKKNIGELLEKNKLERIY